MLVLCAFLPDDSKPVNGESENEKDVSESESNPKPTDQEKQDENQSPNGIRWRSVTFFFSWSLSKIITQLADLFCICLSGPIQLSQQSRKHSQLSPQRPSQLQTQTEKRTAERRTSRCLLRAEPFTNTLWLPSFICVTFCLPTFVTYMSFSCCT